MLALIQRVSAAHVIVNKKIVGEIANGLLVFLGIEKEDTHQQAEQLLEKLLNYRVFADNQDRMNLSIKDVQGGLLIISQFTLAADTKKGLRPSFSSAKEPIQAEVLYNGFVEKAKNSDLTIATGVFGAYMQVNLINDGPVTFLLKV